MRGNPALSDVIMLLLDFTPKFAGSRHLRSLFNVVFRLFSVAHRRSCVSGPHHTLECDIEAYRLDLEWWIKHCPPDWKLAVSGLKMNEHRSRLALSLYCRQDLAPIWEVDIERVESELLAAARRWLDQQLCRARRAFRAAAENGRR